MIDITEYLDALSRTNASDRIGGTELNEIVKYWNNHYAITAVIA